METNGIDLTKCNNLRYKSKIDGNDDYGRICVENADTGLAFLRSDKEDEYVAVWHCDDPAIQGISERTVTDFEIIPRDPGTYRDWQVGDRVCERGNACHEVIFRSGELVVMKTAANTACSNYTCDELFRCGYRLVLTDIEEQIIEGKKKYEPQDGDICYVEASDGYCSIFIYKNGFHRTNYYASLDAERCSTILFTTGGHVVANSKITVLRPATEDEKQQLFEAMSKEGKRWNAEKKVVEDIPKPYEFKKGEPVLARDYDNELWALYAYHEQAGDKHIVKTCFQTVLQSQCIPYNERTMHLLGTTEDYKEE